MGLDLGLEKTGFETCLCVENDSSCVKTINENKKHLPVLGDITKLKTKDLLKAARLKKNEVDLVVGGPPCQSFSTAGRRHSIKDPRGNLIFEYLRVINEVKPRFFVFENVKGLTSAAIKHRPLNDRDKTPLSDEEQLGSVFQYLLAEIEKTGYSIVKSILDSVNYGAPQFRERLIIIGSRDCEDIFIPRPTHFMEHQHPDYRWRTLRQAINDLEDSPGKCGKFSQERTNLLKKIPQGKNWRALPKKLIPSAMGGAYKSGGGKMGFYRRLSYDEPAPTLVTSPVQKATMLCHPTKNRPLSIQEYAAIQEFPGEWSFSGTVAEMYRQIGNAVPISLGKAIGLMLDSVIQGNYKVKTKRIRGTSVHNGTNTDQCQL